MYLLFVSWIWLDFGLILLDLVFVNLIQCFFNVSSRLLVFSMKGDEF